MPDNALIEFIFLVFLKLNCTHFGKYTLYSQCILFMQSTQPSTKHFEPELNKFKKIKLHSLYFSVHEKGWMGGTQFFLYDKVSFSAQVNDTNDIIYSVTLGHNIKEKTNCGPLRASQPCLVTGLVWSQGETLKKIFWILSFYLIFWFVSFWIFEFFYS